MGLKFTASKLPPDAVGVAGTDTYEGHRPGDTFTDASPGPYNGRKVGLIKVGQRLYLVPFAAPILPDRAPDPGGLPQPVTNAMGDLQAVLGVDVPAHLTATNRAARAIRRAVGTGGR